MGGGGGAGRGGGDGSEGGAERLHDAQLQQQIVFALRRLREDMRSVMERLEAVERLAATHVSARADRPRLQRRFSTGGSRPTFGVAALWAVSAFFLQQKNNFKMCIFSRENVGCLFCKMHICVQ